MNITRNLLGPNASWDHEYGVSNRPPQEASDHLRTILDFPEDHRQITSRYVHTDGHFGRSYQMGDPEPSLLGHVSNAFNISREENQSIRDSLHQLRFDIESAFGSAIATHFKSKFNSHLTTSTTPTKRDLVQFFEEHHLMHQFPPAPAEATTVENADAALLLGARVDDSSDDVEPVAEATPLEHPVIARPINDPTDPNFGYDQVPPEAALPVIHLDG
jgi:hypothetical protein